MIYDAAEIQKIEAIRTRKIVEKSIFKNLGIHSKALTSLLDEQLSNDIDRCTVMIRIGENDFSQVKQDIRFISPNAPIAPADALQEYIDKLSPESKEEEAAYRFYCDLLVSKFKLFLKAIVKCDAALNDIGQVSLSDTLEYVKIKSHLEFFKTRCIEQSGNTDLPYKEAEEYIEYALEEISIMNRIANMKDVGIDEMCFHIDWSDEVDKDVFNKLFLPDIPVEERKKMLDFEDRTEDRIITILSRVFYNFEMGLFD